jgi:hypothetical protein
MLARKLTAASASITAGLDPDAITLIAAMTTAPDAARQQLISDHIVQLKADGVWALLDTYYVMAAHHEQASRLNWKSPGDFTLTVNGDMTFTTDRGWQGDGSTGYLDTGWIPATHGVNYTLIDASFGVYSRTNIQNNGIDMGIRFSIDTDETNLSTWPLTDSQSRYRISISRVSGKQVIWTDTNSIGFRVARRSSASAMQAIVNGSQVAQNTSSAASQLNNLSFFISARNEGGTAGDHTPRQYASAFTGAAMSEAQHAALYAAQQNGYLASVGAAV